MNGWRGSARDERNKGRERSRERGGGGGEEDMSGGRLVGGARREKT